MYPLSLAGFDLYFFWSLNYTQYTKTLNSMSLEITNFFGEIADNWRNDLFGKNLYKTIESCQ